MLKYFSFLLTVPFFISCGNHENDEVTPNHELTNNNVSDSIISIVDTVVNEDEPAFSINYESPSQKFLTSNFKEDFVIKFNEIDTKISSIKTSDELKAYQKEVEEFVASFKESVIKKEKKQTIFGAYYEFKDSFNVLQPACFEECMVFGLTYNKESFKNQAKLTPDKNDDDFYKYASIAEEDLRGVNDEGGSSFLGDTSTFNFLKETYPLLLETNPFYNEYLDLRKEYLQNMYRSLFLYSSLSVLKEANEIFAANNLTEDEYYLVKEAIEKINNCTDCQFDCLAKGCTW